MCRCALQQEVAKVVAAQSETWTRSFSNAGGGGNQGANTGRMQIA